MGIKDTLHRSAQKLKKGAKRAFHQEINLAVAGFSGAGKSTFTTSFIHQLLHQNKHQNLHFFQASEDKRIIACQIEESKNLTIRQFPYEESLERLERKEWPKPTEKTSAVTLQIKYKVEGTLTSVLSKNATLTINLVDYPGEWILDLLLLQQDFATWSRDCEKLFSLNETLYSDWKAFCSEINDCESASSTGSNEIKNWSETFKQLVLTAKNVGVSISPGRFQLPGELKDTPVLDFFPLPEKWLTDESQNVEKLRNHLENRFNAYREQVVQPFFDTYFSTVDRQIVLVDCLALLKVGSQQQALLVEQIEQLTRLFSYGTSSWLRRLWSPKIDKLIIAATKCDHIPSDQQIRLQKFVENLFYSVENKLKFFETEIEYLTIASVQATTPVLAEIDEQQVHCVAGNIAGESEKIIVYPGKIPTSTSEINQSKSESNAEKQSDSLSKASSVSNSVEKESNVTDYDFPSYLPPQIELSRIPHIRMGKAIEFLLGDLFL